MNKPTQVEQLSGGIAELEPAIEAALQAARNIAEESGYQRAMAEVERHVIGTELMSPEFYTTGVIARAYERERQAARVSAAGAQRDKCAVEFASIMSDPVKAASIRNIEDALLATPLDPQDQKWLEARDLAQFTKGYDSAQEPMDRCGHAHANLQPDDTGHERCVACEAVNQQVAAAYRRCSELISSEIVTRAAPTGATLLRLFDQFRQWAADALEGKPR